MVRRIGIVGFGHLGEYLVKGILADQNCGLEVAFVWNRNPQKLASYKGKVPILQELSDFPAMGADVIVEVAHPDITKEFGLHFLKQAHYLIGSPTVLADKGIRDSLVSQCQKGTKGLYIARGAMIGLEDLLSAQASGRIHSLSVMMEKAPDSIHYSGPELPIPLASLTERTVIYDGPLGPLCGYTPNNVNTMAVAALACGLDFTDVQAKLIAHPGLGEHIVQIKACGPAVTGEMPFSLFFEKHNPAKPGAVTGQATYQSFFQSLKRSGVEGSGLHFC